MYFEFFFSLKTTLIYMNFYVIFSYKNQFNSDFVTHFIDINVFYSLKTFSSGFSILIIILISYYKNNVKL